MAQFLTNDRLGRLALSTIAAVMAGIAFLGICSDMFRALGVWLLYAVTCAVLLNTARGERAGVLARLAILPTLTPLLVWAYPALFAKNGVACVSGVPLKSRDWDVIFEFCLYFVAMSWVGITLFGFARNRVFAIIISGASPETAARILNISKVLRAIVTVLGSLGLLWLAITGQQK
jgi:hypothetical protein